MHIVQDLKAAAVLPVVALALSASGILAQEVQNYEVPGNLAPQYDPGCIGLERVEPVYSPADLALAVQGCVAAKHLGDAADLFLLLMARARFDSLRVADLTAHQAVAVLQLQLAAELDEAEITEFDTALEAGMQALQTPGDPLCARLRGTGVPGHDPTWMIAHGMDAVMGKSDAPLVAGFDPGAAWAEVTTGYLNCP